jgi:hypothetical protein
MEKGHEMRINKSTIMMMGLLLTGLTFVSTARADGLRSYISNNGSDNRPCTRSQPCRTFDAALAKTDAGGEIVALESGTYDPTTITKSITLAAAPGADVAIRASAGNAVTVTPGIGDSIVLRGLRIGGPGKNVEGTNGVLVDITSPTCCITVHLENTIISDFEEGLQMNLGVAARLVVSDSVLRSNKTGVNFSVGGAEANGASFERTRFEHNDTGLLAPSGNTISISNSIAVANGTGFRTEGGHLDIFNSVMTKNSVGLKTSTGNARISYCSITGNGTGVSTSSGLVHSMGNNMIANNDIDVAGANSFLTFLPR